MADNNNNDKIDQQIKRVEEIVNKLLEDIDLSEITSFDKLGLVVKFMAQHSRLLAMKNVSELNEPEKQGLAILTAFQRHLRGEMSIEE